ncbi:MAG: T9SS type A sorting domain-containing protein [Bacteroidia bacterium]
MKKPNPKQPETSEEQQDTLEAYRDKLAYQNSAIKKLNALLSKPKKILSLGLFIILTSLAFSQSVDMTWVAGEKTADVKGIYGAKGLTPDAIGPGARDNSAITVDDNGDLWLFGGDEYSIHIGPNLKNDLWKYSNGQWVWLSGSKTKGQSGKHGVKNTASSSNVPSSRMGATCWVDNDNNFWLFGGYGLDKTLYDGLFNDLWKWDGENWTWISGSNVINKKGVYSNIGVGNLKNVPGSRTNSSAFIKNGQLHLFGGYGYDANGNKGYLGDLWKWDGTYWVLVNGGSTRDYRGQFYLPGYSGVPGTRSSTTISKDDNGDIWMFGGYGYDDNGGLGYLSDLWKWDGVYWTYMAGSKYANNKGVFGTKGTSSSSSIPGSRSSAVILNDDDGDLWLFGGKGFANSLNIGLLNDLWKWDGSDWTWMSGSNTLYANSKYGRLNKHSSLGVPGARRSNYGWSDGDDLYFYGGDGQDSTKYGFLSDTWKWDGTKWIWTGGSKTVNVQETYDIINGPAIRIPGARKNSASFQADNGDLYLFGGHGFDANGDEGYLSDLWVRDFESGNWTWLKGSDLEGQSASYGTKGTGGSTNQPGKREGANIWYKNGVLWLYGGYYKENGTDYYLNDLWKWSGGNWTWVKGDNIANNGGVYTGSNSSLSPGARTEASSWMADNGVLWLFGGQGYDKNGDKGRLNDLWKFSGSNWTFINGDKVKNAATVYGHKGTADALNKPGGRSASSAWKDADGNFWLFAGNGYDANGVYGSFNDFWKFDGSNWTWMHGANTRNSAGVYGKKYEENASNIPGARSSSMCWHDANGKIWVFGGYGRDNSNTTGRLNDLWRFDGSNWAWVAGAKTINQNATYNVLNVTSNSSVIGARSACVKIINGNETLILGGLSRDENGNTGSFNDTWKISYNNWITNGKDNELTWEGLNIASSETSGNALQDDGDKLEITKVAGTLAEKTSNLSNSPNVAKRFDKKWTLAKTDINGNGGSLDLTFDIGKSPNSDYSYYLLTRSGTSGNFSVINNVNYKPDGNTIVFTTDFDEINDGNQFSVGISSIGAGYALDFVRTNSDRIDLNDLTFNPTTSGGFTIELWFKASYFGNNPSLIAQKDGTGTGRTFIAISASGYLKCNLNGAGIQSTNKVIKDQWTHATITYNAGEVNMYLNGVLEKTQSETAESATGRWVIGRTKINNQYFDGQMDELRIWKGVRTSHEIDQNMFRTLLGTETNLLAYYKFDQANELYLPDVSLNNNQGELTNFSLSGSASNWVISTCPVVDKTNAKKLEGPGNGIDFDGTNDYVNLGSILDPSAGDWTFEAWIKPEDLSNTYHVLLSQKDGTGTGDTYLTFQNGKPKLILGPNKIAADAISINNWYHVAINYDKSETLQTLYLDGIKLIETVGSISAADGTLQLGRSKNGTNYFNGKIDEIRFWSSCRTQTEIQDNMYASLEGDETALVAYYHCNHASGTTLTDATTNSNNGTLTNFSGTYWVSAADREPFKTIKTGNHNANSTWKGGTAPSASSDKLAVFHDLTLATSGTYSRLQVNSGQTITTNADITISGEVIVNGTTNGSSKIIMNGSIKQCLSGSGSLHNLQINNGNDVSLEGDLSLTGSLFLTNGDIEINDHTFTLSEFTFAGNSSSYLKLNGTGKVKVTVGSSPVILPIGRNPYLPIIIDDGGDAEYTVGISDKVFADPTNPTTELTTNVVTETWTIQSSSSVNDVIVQIGWDATEEANFVRGNSGIAYWEDGVSNAWQKPGSTTAATGSGPYFQTRTMDFSTNLYYLGVGDNSSPLPVDLTYFTTAWHTNGKTAILNWQTALEENNSHFEIERSFDGQVWEQVGTVTGQGTTFDITDYQFIDRIETENARLETQVYYRLKQIDYNGDFDYSPIKTLNLKQDALNSFNVWPNPANDAIVNLTEIGNYKIYNAQGVLLSSHLQTQKLDISMLPKGTYIIKNEKGSHQVLVRQ